MLLFVRFARELKRRGATVLVLCQALLKELLANVDFIDTVVAEGEKLPDFDVHASMVSLPHLCRADFDALAAEPAYLHPPADSRIKLGRIEKAKLRIGIYWAAMPGQPQDRQRSAPFAEFLALAGDPELLVFSLQGGVHQRDIQQFGAGGLVHDVGRGIFDFAEAATALSQLDLLLSIDAPIAHLAAAMGIKTWVLLPSTVDWRWQLGGTGRPGIPRRACSASPSRATGDSVFAEVRAELALLKQSVRPPDLQAPQILRVVDIVQRVGQADRDRRRKTRQRVGQRLCRRPAHAANKARGIGFRRRAPTSQKPPSLAGPKTRSCRPSRRKAWAIGRRAAPECRCRPAPPAPAAAPGTAASCAARDRPRPCGRRRGRGTGAAPCRMAEAVIGRHEQPDRPAAVVRQPPDLVRQGRAIESRGRRQADLAGEPALDPAELRRAGEDHEVARHRPYRRRMTDGGTPAENRARHDRLRSGRSSQPSRS